MTFNPDPTNAQVLAWHIAQHPGSTERELAERMFGSAGYQQRVNADARWLETHGIIKRDEIAGVNRLRRI